MSERFHQPENFDRAAEGAGWKLYVGANDWEHAHTWMACVFPGDEENKRVWIEINYDGHGNPDGEVRYDGPEAKEAKAWGERAQKTWLRVAKRLHSEKKEHDIQRQWIDAFKDALQDDEVKPFIKQSGTDRTNWEPMKESKAIVAALLEDDEVERLTDQVSANGYVVVTTGSAGQKLYWVGPRDRYSSYAKEATIFPTPEAAHQSVGHYRLYDYRIQVWLGENEEDPKDFVDRSDVRYIITASGMANQKMYWQERGVVARRGQMVPDKEDATQYRNKASAEDQCYGLRNGAFKDATVEVLIKRDIFAESDEVDGVLDRSQTGFCITATSRNSGATLYLTHRSWDGDPPWRFSSYEEDKFLFANVAEAEKVLPIARNQRPDAVLQVVITRPENKLPDYSTVTENEEADDFIERLDSKAKDRLCYIAWGKDDHRYYVRYTPKQKNYNWHLKSTLVVLPEQATKFPFSKAVKLMQRDLSDGFEIVPIEVEAENIAAYRRRCHGLAEATYNRSTCQIDAPEDIKDFVLQWGMLNIPDDKLFVESDGGKGREDEIHVTVRYGLDFAQPSEEFRRLITTCKSFPIRLAGISLFKNDKFDVVKLDVISDDLIRLNAEIRQQFPSQQQDTFPDYHPHMTVAYVQPGSCDALAGADPFKGSQDVQPEFEAERLRFSGAGDTEKGDRVIDYIPFDSSKSTEQRREELAAEVVEALVDNSDADDFLARMDDRYYVLRFNVKLSPAPGRWSSPPAWDGMYWGSQPYTDDPAQAERFKTFAGAEEGRRGLAHSLHVLLIDVDIVVVIDGKPVARYGWPSSERYPTSESEGEADDFMTRISPEQFVIRLNSVSYRQVDPSVGGYGRWGSLENATFLAHADAVEEVNQLRLHPSLQHSYIDIVPVNSLRMAESADPFKSLDFPADATEVLTKIRARRNKRRSPVWF